MLNSEEKQVHYTQMLRCMHRFQVFIRFSENMYELLFAFTLLMTIFRNVMLVCTVEYNVPLFIHNPKNYKFFKQYHLLTFNIS